MKMSRCSTTEPETYSWRLRVAKTEDLRRPEHFSQSQIRHTQHHGAQFSAIHAFGKCSESVARFWIHERRSAGRAPLILRLHDHPRRPPVCGLEPSHRSEI